MLPDGGHNRNNPNVTTNLCRATSRENKQSILATNAHVADINTDRLEDRLKGKYVNHLQCHEAEKEIETNHDNIAGSRRISRKQGTIHSTHDTEVKGQLFHFRIGVVSAKANNLLSRSVASRMGFILKVDEFEETLDDTGCLNTEPVSK